MNDDWWSPDALSAYGSLLGGLAAFTGVAVAARSGLVGWLRAYSQRARAQALNDALRALGGQQPPTWWRVWNVKLHARRARRRQRNEPPT